MTPESGRFRGAIVRKGTPKSEFHDYESGLPSPFKSVVTCRPPDSPALVVDGRIRTFTRKRDRRCQAHARIAGDKRFAAREPAGALVAILAMIRPQAHFDRWPGRLLRLGRERQLRVLGQRILVGGRLGCRC
jgi:hypothetical protein